MLGRTIGKVGLGGRRTAWAYTVLAQQDTGQHAVLLGLKRAGTRAWRRALCSVEHWAT